MTEISRRNFVVLTSSGAIGAPFALSQQQKPSALTAQGIVDRIKRDLGVEWKPETVDGFKAGDPATTITGIATAALATIEVLKKAVSARANLIITSEPTFFSRADTVTSDRVVAAKSEFIKSHNLVVWRFSDHWRLRTPEPFAAGLLDALGWTKGRSADAPGRAAIPGTRLDTLASHIRKTLNGRGGTRVVGPADMRVQTVAVLPGTTPIQAALANMPSVDAIVAGEVREWESVEYARDILTSGGKKGLILVGRIVSEEPGMRACAQWLKGVVPEVASAWISAGDPYWRPL